MTNLWNTVMETWRHIANDQSQALGGTLIGLKIQLLTRTHCKPNTQVTAADLLLYGNNPPGNLCKDIKNQKPLVHPTIDCIITDDVTARPKAKPKHLYLLLMAGCNIVYKQRHLHVRRQMGPRWFLLFKLVLITPMYVQLFTFFDKFVFKKVVWGQDWHQTMSPAQHGAHISDILSISTEQYEEVLVFFLLSSFL